MNTMIDVHSHILPNFDDGAQDKNEAMAMLKMANDNGTIGIVATPHVQCGANCIAWEDIVSACEQLSAEAKLAGLDITVYPGAEVAVSKGILDFIVKPGAYCLNNGKYLLTELPNKIIPQYIDEFFFYLQARGIVPVIAHPERNATLANAPELLNGWVKSGCLAQLNASSLLGSMGRKAKKTAEMFLAKKLVHVIGSDAHGVKKRRPRIQEAADLICQLYNSELVSLLFLENPRLILAGEDIKQVNRSEMHKSLSCSIVKQLKCLFKKSSG